MTVQKNQGKVKSFLDPGSRSCELFQRARKVLPGGNTRTSLYFPPNPWYAAYGKGCRIIDVEGVERIDFHNNYTSLIHGHADPDVVKAVGQQLEKGTAYGAPTEFEIELAEILVERVKSIQQASFANSGSESVYLAIRMARAYTGREKIAKFAGSYHGSYDDMEVSVGVPPKELGSWDNPLSVMDSEGIPRAAFANTITLPFNNKAAVEKIITQNHKELAAVIADPLPSRMGLCKPDLDFYPFVREITRKYGILFIADEVMMFRLSYGGGQELFGMNPDITTFGKIIGGGFPVGGYGASKEIMAVFDPTLPKLRVPHAGTFNANPMTLLAGIVTVRKFDREAIKRLNALGDSLRLKVNTLFKTMKIKGQAKGMASMFRVHLTDISITDWRGGWMDPKRKEMTTKLFYQMLENGIVQAPEGIGCLSTPMKEKEIDSYVAALEKSLANLVKEYPDLKK